MSTRKTKPPSSTHTSNTNGKRKRDEDLPPSDKTKKLKVGVSKSKVPIELGTSDEESENVEVEPPTEEVSEPKTKQTPLDPLKEAHTKTLQLLKSNEIPGEFDPQSWIEFEKPATNSNENCGYPCCRGGIKKKAQFCGLCHAHKTPNTSEMFRSKIRHLCLLPKDHTLHQCPTRRLDLHSVEKSEFQSFLNKMNKSHVLPNATTAEEKPTRSRNKDRNKHQAPPLTKEEELEQEFTKTGVPVTNMTLAGWKSIMNTMADTPLEVKIEKGTTEQQPFEKKGDADTKDYSAMIDSYNITSNWLLELKEVPEDADEWEKSKNVSKNLLMGLVNMVLLKTKGAGDSDLEQAFFLVQYVRKRKREQLEQEMRLKASISEPGSVKQGVK